MFAEYRERLEQAAELDRLRLENAELKRRLSRQPWLMPAQDEVYNQMRNIHVTCGYYSDYASQQLPLNGLFGAGCL